MGTKQRLPNVPPNRSLCLRCHGFYKIKYSNQSTPRRRISSLFSSNNNNNNQNDNNVNNNDLQSNDALYTRRYIEYLHIAPFENTLNGIEEKEICEEYIIETYLRPYFHQNPNLEIQARNRMIIKNVEFKVFGCYP